MTSRSASIAVNAALVAVAVLTMLPLAWMVSASFMPAGEAQDLPPRLLPSSPTLAHYRALFTRLDVAQYFANSLLIAASVTGISLVVNGMAGYAFAKLRFRGRDSLFSLLLAGMVVPAQVGMLPLFLMLKQIHVINTYWGVIIPMMASIYGIFLIRQYTLSVPNAVLDSARVDGASEWRVFRSIVVPLIRPILVTLGLFTFMASWNDFLWPLVVLTDNDRHTLPVALALLSGEHVQDTELMMAGAVVTVLPVLVLFLALQKTYISGIMLGSVKE